MGHLRISTCNDRNQPTPMIRSRTGCRERERERERDLQVLGRMLFFASIHILLTCSFVLLLAYLLSRIFSHIASSFINGSGKARKDSDGSRPPRLASIERQIEEEETEEGVMTRLQEDDEENEYGDAETQAPPGLAAKYEAGNSIFYDVIAAKDELNRDGPGQAPWNDDEGMDDERLAADRGGGSLAEHEYKDSEDGMGWEMNKLGAAAEGEVEGGGEGDASRVLSSIEKLKEDKEEEKKGDGHTSKLGDAQGSSSLQQRLPPTWSDLERIVSLSSKSPSSPPSVPSLDE